MVHSRDTSRIVIELLQSLRRAVLGDDGPDLSPIPLEEAHGALMTRAKRLLCHLHECSRVTNLLRCEAASEEALGVR